MISTCVPHDGYYIIICPRKRPKGRVPSRRLKIYNLLSPSTHLGFQVTLPELDFIVGVAVGNDSVEFGNDLTQQ